MPTFFPLNKIPTIPLKILSVLLPVFFKQKKFLNKVIGELQQKVDGLSKTATCGDVEINAIKQDLEQIKQLVENIYLVKIYFDIYFTLITSGHRLQPAIRVNFVDIYLDILSSNIFHYKKITQ